MNECSYERCKHSLPVVFVDFSCMISKQLNLNLKIRRT